jgi:hypothetical protein
VTGWRAVRTLVRVWSDEERAQKLVQLEAKLKPERIRSTLAFAGLYQLTHELIKQVVVPKVREFFLTGFDEKGMYYDEEAYKRDVLSKDRRVLALLTLLWVPFHGRPGSDGQRPPLVRSAMAISASGLW